MARLRLNQCIDAKVIAPLTDTAPFTAANLINDYGMSVDGDKAALHNNHPLGSTMWAIQNRKQDFELVFDLGGSLPLGEMLVWNYNRAAACGHDYTLCGLRCVNIDMSLSGIHWEPWGETVFAKASGADNMPATTVIDFGGRTVRYIRFTVSAKPGVGNYDTENSLSDCYGLSKVKFFVGRGFAVERDEEWTALLCNNEGWTGSDGVFTIPMNGSERYTAGADTTITFGDTLIDSIDPKTLHRSSGLHMIHNSYCIVPGSKPCADKRVFDWGKDENGDDDSLLKPPLSVQNDTTTSGYYWPQDSILVGESCYTYPLTVLDWPEGPEGFQFKVDGVAMVISPVVDGKILFDKAEHFKTNLYYDDGCGRSIMYGGCTFPNTAAGGAAEPDGFIYLYGTIHEGLATSLCVARIPEQNIDDGMGWKFYDGSGWCDDIKMSAGLADEVSCEHSISCAKGELFKGEYLLVYQEKVNSPFVAYRTAKSPWGPFSEPKRLFFTDEVVKGRGIYTYNAKGHPHLASPDELLISYNVNTIAWEMHEVHGDICRPKFLRLYEVIE